MQLTQLHISHIRAIDDLEIDLSINGIPRRRVILLGANGVGKTTVLDAIVHLVESHTSYGGRRLSSDDVPFPHKTGHIKATQWINGKSEIISHPVPENIPLKSIFPVDLGPYDFVHPSIAPKALPCVLLPSRRGVLDPVLNGNISELQGFSARKHALSKDSTRFSLLAARLALLFGSTSTRDPDRSVARMWKVLDAYFPDLPRPEYREGLEIFFRTRSGQLVPLPALSDGERAILLIFAELAMHPLKGGMVLIDEPEQHLHPRWQRALLDGLSALLPDTQFILTTQSPYFAACAPDDRLRLPGWEENVS